MANIQIPKKLFMALINYHIAGLDVDESYIKRELQKKVDAMARRQEYSERLKQQETEP